MFVTSNRAEPFLSLGTPQRGDAKYWRWGDDNLFPYALALMSRRATVHRRIINDKADYISGKGFAFDTRISPLAELAAAANGSGESLRRIIHKLAFDKALFGNAFLEVVTDGKRSFLSLFHQDASKCRLSKDMGSVLLHHDWAHYTAADARELPLYPVFSERADGTLRSVIHYKDYEPMFENYGVPNYIAGLNVSAIAYKTDKWNISRLDNSFQLSGMMVIDGGAATQQEAAEIIKAAQEKFASNPGQVMFVLKNGKSADNSKFVPITASNEGDWRDLHEQASTDIVVAHSWFRTLSGLDYSSGFSSERILNEYEVALNTIIIAEQEMLMEPIRSVVETVSGVDASSLQVVNRPPAKARPGYMRVWEARKADGLDFDMDDPAQRMFLAQFAGR